MNGLELVIKKAEETDIEAILSIYADDDLAAQREDFSQPRPQAYFNAFKKIEANSTTKLYLVNVGNEAAATFQLHWLTYLSYKGGTRLLVENVFVKKGFTGKGIGKAVFQFIKEEAQKTNCYMVQLTTNKLRPDAKRFYESVGFTATHEGMKMFL